MRVRCARLKRDCRLDLPAKLMTNPRQRRDALDDEQCETELAVQWDGFRFGQIRRKTRIRNH